MLNLRSISVVILHLYFIFINEEPIISKTLLVVILLVGLFVYFRDFRNNLENDDKVILTIFLLYFLSYIPSFISEPNFEFRIVDHPSRFVLLIPTFFIIKRYINFNIKYLFLMCTYIQSFIIIYNFIFNDASRGFSYNSCISGAQHLLLFGCFTFYLSLTEKKKTFRILLLIGYLISIISIILSQTRGVILCVPVIFILTLILSGKIFSYFNTLVTLSVLSISSLVIFNNQTLMSRLEVTVENINYNFNKYEHSDFDYGSSLGQRISYLKFGFNAFKLNPLFGSGRKGFVDSMVAVGYPDSEITHVTHLHNQYLSDLTMRGIFGFISTITFMLYLLLMFIKKRKQNNNEYSNLGIIFISSYLLYFLTDSTFIGSMHSLRFFIPMYFILYSASSVSNKSLDKPINFCSG